MNTYRILTAASAVVLAGSALAADLPRRAPAPYIAPPPVMTWTGFYIGLNAGAAIRSNNNNNSSNNFLLATTLGVNPAFLANNNSNSQVAFVGGGQMGYNWQTGPVVFGLEVDAQYRSSFGQNSNGFFGAGLNRNNDGFLGTARGRLGYSFTPAFLIYATGGAAFGNTFGSNNFNSFPFGFGAAGLGFNSNNNNNNFRVGYTVGGGLEYMFSPSWSIKTEYLFVDLRSNNNNNNFFFSGGSNRSQAHIARVGVNYRFNFLGAAPVVARY